MIEELGKARGIGGIADALLSFCYAKEGYLVLLNYNVQTD
jgi:hypothetical protein